MPFVVVDGCPVPRRLAKFVRALKHDVPTAKLNSAYRGDAARDLLHRFGKHTQRELYDGYRKGLPGYLPANPPGFSSHELHSDGNSVYGVPRGGRLKWWQCGLDFNDQDVPKLIAAAKRRGWDLRQPYPSGSEFHHVNFAKRPRLVPVPHLPYWLKARKAGARYARKIQREARRAGMQLSLAYAIVEHESGFRNVYGHDPVRNPAPKGGKVTRSNYLHVYLPARQKGLGMQGVGPLQLTWYATQDLADKEGGCWRPKCNIRVGLRTLAQNVKAKGEFQGVAAYNGSGPAAQSYARAVLAGRDRWHKILEGGL